MQNTENKHTKALNSSYKTKVIGMLLGLLVFVLVYLSLVAAASWFLYWSIVYPLPRWSIISIGFKIGIVTMAATLLVFLLKFLFHRRKIDYSQYTEIHVENYPDLFNFIQEISQEADAPMPKKVFVDASINAKVFYDRPALGWLKSSNKNLLIGLGLVNGINRSEFKAVLAHEFGHFTQRSMRLGTYSYMITRNIYAMVYQKDRVDQFIEKWKYAGVLRLSMFAWALSPILEFVRFILIMMAKRLNYLQSSMSRQMEFQADLVAVRLAGSNAIINTLYKLTNINKAFKFSLQQIDMAAENGLVTNNVFQHYRGIHEYLMHYNLNYAKKDLSKRKVLAEKASYLFKQNDLSTPDMYASHPPSYYRELNAKQTFIVAEEDHRSAWTLFGDPEPLQKWVSQQFLKQRLKLDEAEELQTIKATEVETFIQEELDSVKLSNDYLGVYSNGRLLNVIDVEKPNKYGGFKENTLSELSELIGDLYGEQFEQRMQMIQKRQTEFKTIVPYLQNPQFNQPFEFRGDWFDRTAVDKVHALLKQEHIEDQLWYKQFDQKSFVYHYWTAQKLELDVNLYQALHLFLYNIRSYYQQFSQLKQKLHLEIQRLKAAGNRLNYKQLVYHIGMLKSVQTNGNHLLNGKAISPPLPLTNIPNKSIQEYLLPEGLVQIPDQTIERTVVDRLIQQLDLILLRLDRLYFKALSRLLKYQEEIQAQCKLALG